MQVRTGFNLSRVAAAIAIVTTTATLIACGGGGSSSGSTTPVSLSGVAATGAPLAGATIVVKDATGATVCTATAAADGSYSCTLASTAQAPFVVTATLDDTTLVSATASTTSATVNVTPVTHVISARLASNGDPTQLAASAFTATTLADRVTEVNTALQPLRTAAGDTTNPISGSFTANGSTHDQLLDALQVSVRPVANSSGSITSANIDITVKTRPSTNEAAPVNVSFSSSVTSVPALPTVSSGSLVSGNVPALMQDLMTRLGTCYALPLAQRVTGSNVTGTACRTLFSGDDPSTFRNNGDTVGPTGAFSGMFSANGNGTVFERATFEFLRMNGDAVISYRWVTPAGISDTARVVVTTQSGAYKLIGNQNLYSGVVRPYVQKRDFVRSNYSQYNYHSTGYNVVIANKLDGSNNPLFSHVVVTTPRGNSFTYRPSASQAYLQLQRGATTETFNTSVMRLAAAYISSSTAGNPSSIETNLAFATTQWTDTELAAIPDQGVWRFDYHLAAGGTPVTEYYRTSSRAPTIAEARAMAYAAPTAAARTALASSAPSGYISFSTAPASATANQLRLNVDGGAWWTVPTGALPPTGVAAFGARGTPAVRFDDSVAVPSTARQATVACSVQSVGDTHCDSTHTTSFAQGAYIFSIDLSARSQKQLQVSSMMATYNPNPL